MNKTTSLQAPKATQDKPTGPFQASLSELNPACFQDVVEALNQYTPWHQWKAQWGLSSLDSKAFLPAVTHSSFLNEQKDPSAFQSYERLEFMGDTVVQYLVSFELLHRYPNLSEGELSKLRGAIVNLDSLSELARVLDLGQWALLGKGEEREGGREKSGLLCDVMEALLGAHALALGIENTSKWFSELIATANPQLTQPFYDHQRVVEFDPKSTLQELTLQLYKEVPIYETLEEDGTQRQFTLALKVCGVELARGSGPSKKQIMKELARDVLAREAYRHLYRSPTC
jgi:ribonuclease III